MLTCVQPCRSVLAHEAVKIILTLARGGCLRSANSLAAARSLARNRDDSAGLVQYLVAFS